LEEATLVYFYISLLLTRSDESADNVKSSWPVQVGLHICYNEDIKNRALYLRLRLNVFPVRIAFCNLKSVKMESPVIANQPSCGEQVLEFCTNRPSRSGRVLA